MIKIVAADYVNDHEIRLHFSDDSSGIFDFTPFLDAGTPMTEPLRDPGFFRSFYLELGALAWPGDSAHVKPPFRTMGSQWRAPG